MYNHQLDTFIQVADTGSFGKAADLLYISAPAVMKQIRLLEDKCGSTLFDRTNHGVTLTAAGRSLYDDAKTIIHLSDEALNRARHLADKSESTVRIGTSLLFKCRLLPDIWAQLCNNQLDLKMEILPIPEKQSRGDSISYLGTKYDIREGIIGTGADLDGKFNYLQLTSFPICCAVSRGHRLSNYKSLTMTDLNGECIVMPIEGASEQLDAFRAEVNKKYPTISIVDSPYYGTDTFTMCEINQYVLITQEVYTDIHTNLLTIPLETKYALPYGLMYSVTPTPATRKFISEVEKINS